MRRHLGPLLALAILAAVALAACGGGGSRTSSSAASSSAVSTVTRTVTTSSSTSSAASTTTSSQTTVGSVHCRAAGLTLSFLGQQGATGHGLLGFAVRNVLSRSCPTMGYPGIQFLSRSGAPLVTDPIRTTNDFFGRARLAALVLAPGAIASFRLGVTHGAVPGSVCATAYALQVIPPNDTASLRVKIPDGAYECRTATVSPLEAGTSAYP